MIANPKLVEPSGLYTGEGGGVCRRPDLASWAAQGGPLSLRLAVHAARCAHCAAWVRRINRVHADCMSWTTVAELKELLASSIS